MKCALGRKVYIDAGVNWANTARLFEDLSPPPNPERLSTGWSVFGFEASPLIQPFAEAYFDWLDGNRTTNPPESCLPRSGSSVHLSHYALAYGCPAAPANTMRRCMVNALHDRLAALQTDPRLNSTALVTGRLSRATRRSCGPAVLPTSFTFIPAAVGVSPAMVRVWASPEQLVRGGAIPQEAWHDEKHAHRVHQVDLPSWIARSFTEQDHVVLKVYVEGAEVRILRLLLARRLLRLIAVLIVECHFDRRFCASFLAEVAVAAPQMQLVSDHSSLSLRSDDTNHTGFKYLGYDSYSQPPSMQASRTLAQRCQAPGTGGEYGGPRPPTGQAGAGRTKQESRKLKSS